MEGCGKCGDIRRKVENDREDESGEEEGSEQGSSDQVGKTSGIGPEDYADQEEDSASTQCQDLTCV